MVKLNDMVQYKVGHPTANTFAVPDYGNGVSLAWDIEQTDGSSLNIERVDGEFIFTAFDWDEDKQDWVGTELSRNPKYVAPKGFDAPTVLVDGRPA